MAAFPADFVNAVDGVAIGRAECEMHVPARFAIKQEQVERDTVAETLGGAVHRLRITKRRQNVGVEFQARLKPLRFDFEVIDHGSAPVNCGPTYRRQRVAIRRITPPICTEPAQMPGRVTYG
jgi:hypothetical protein